MKKLMLRLLLVAGLASFGCRMAQAQQDPAGSWQGTLKLPNATLRVELVVTKAGTALKSTFYSLDQGGNGLGVTSTSLQDGTLKFAIVGMDVKFEGKLTADGKSAVGTWTQGAQSLPLTLDHVNADAAWALPVVTAAMKPMPRDAVPGYDVATVKPSKPDQQGRGFTLRGRHFVTINTNVEALLMFAYNLQSKQIVGGPDWLRTDGYDLDVLPDVEGLPSIKQSGDMTKKILNERFHLKFHEEQRELPVYVLSVAKTGPKLTLSGDQNGIPGLGFRAPGKFIAHDATLEEFAGLMQSAVLDRPVVDQTGLKGRFDWELNWQPDESQFGGRVPPPTEGAETLPSLYTAITEQNGLKLEPMKTSVKVMVIDSISRPTDN